MLTPRLANDALEHVCDAANAIDCLPGCMKVWLIYAWYLVTGSQTAQLDTAEHS